MRTQYNHKKSLLNRIDEKNEINEDLKTGFLYNNQSSSHIKKNPHNSFDRFKDVRPSNLAFSEYNNNVFSIPNKYQNKFFENSNNQNDKQNILKQDFQKTYSFPLTSINNSFQQSPNIFPQSNRKINFKNKNQLF